MATHDLRRHPREMCTQKVAIQWCDSAGNDKCASALTVDVSDLGLSMLVPEALAVRSFVTLRGEKMAVHGQASVRHCSRQGMKYRVGVEIARGLRVARPAAN